jgi:hypothetical protein
MPSSISTCCAPNRFEHAINATHRCRVDRMADDRPHGHDRLTLKDAFETRVGGGERRHSDAERFERRAQLVRQRQVVIGRDRAEMQQPLGDLLRKRARRREERQHNAAQRCALRRQRIALEMRPLDRTSVTRQCLPSMISVTKYNTNLNVYRLSITHWHFRHRKYAVFVETSLCVLDIHVKICAYKTKVS